MTNLAIEVTGLSYSMIMLYVIPGIVAGVLYLFPSRRDLAAKRYQERNQKRYLSAIS